MRLNGPVFLNQISEEIFFFPVPNITFVVPEKNKNSYKIILD